MISGQPTLYTGAVGRHMAHLASAAIDVPRSGTNCGYRAGRAVDERT